MRFDGRTAIVTGGGSGIGRAVAAGIARGGGRVAVVDIDAAAAQAAAAEIGSDAVAIVADLARPEAIAHMAREAEAALGRIDILHNNAFGLPPDLAALRPARIDALDPRVWDATIAIGLNAAMHATRLVVPIMRRHGGGAIVNTASVAGLVADSGNAAYNSVKAALIHFTRSIAMEFARENIRVNCLCPGLIDSPMLRRGAARRGIGDGLGDTIPMGRVGTPEEAANLALFLASDLASFVTGGTFVVDGGLSVTNAFAISYGERPA